MTETNELSSQCSLMSKLVKLELAKSELKLSECSERLDALEKHIKSMQVLEEGEEKAARFRGITEELDKLTLCIELYALSLKSMVDDQNCDPEITVATIDSLDTRMKKIKEAIRLFGRLDKI